MTDPPPAPDPRLYEKNFAMPMNPAGFSGFDTPSVRRKDGADVPLPNSPTYGTPFRPDTVESSAPPAFDTPALHATLVRKADGSRSVTVTEGFVTEFITKAGTTDDGVIEHPINGIWDGTHPNLLAEHPLTEGRAVGVLFPVDEKGFVSGSASISRAVSSDDEKSTHYVPPVGDDTAGASGTVFVALARLIGSGDAERLEVIHEGNIHHYHELPMFVKYGGTHDIFKRFNKDTGKFETFGLSPGDGITITKGAGDITVALDTEHGFDHDLTMRFLKLVTGSPTVVYIDIPALKVTGSTGVMVDGTLTPDGDHQHYFNDVQSGGTAHGTFGFTGTGAGRTTTPAPDGAHTHNVVGSTVALTSSDGTARPSVTIPGSVSLAVDTSAGYRVYCYRAGRLVGVYANGAGKPPLPIGGTSSEFYAWGGP